MKKLENIAFEHESRSAAIGSRKSNFYYLRAVILVFLLFSLVFRVQAQSLELYQTQAAENNPGLKAQYKMFESAMQRIDQASALQDPNLSFGYFISPVETRVGPQRARLSLSQMFPWFGTRSLQSDVARLQAEAQYQSFESQKNLLAYQVAAAYYPLYELAELKAIVKENIGWLQSLKKLSTKQFEQSEGTMVAVVRVDIMLADAQTELAILEEQEGSLLLSFNNLINREADARVALPDSLPLITNDNVTDTVWDEHPEIKALALKIEGSQKAELLAQKRGLPKIGVGLDYVMIGERTDLASGVAPPADNGKDAFMPMVTVSLPIFRKNYRAAVKESQLMQENYQLQQEQSINSLESAVGISQFELGKQQQLISLYQSQMRSSEQALRLYQSAYANGSSSIEDLISMQQKLLQYQKMLVQAQVAYLVEVAKMTYLKGGQK